MMDSGGRILSPEEVSGMSETRKAELVEIPDAEVGRLQGMSNRERREWYWEQRRKRRLAELRRS